MNLNTYEGGSVEAVRHGVVLHLVIRDAAGRTVFSVEMDENEAFGLFNDLSEELDWEDEDDE